MIKADKYFVDLLNDIEENGVWSKKPRTRWDDGTKAHYKSVYGKEYVYDISKGEFPISTLRNTAFRGCFEEISWIYQKQSNIIEDAHPCIHSWWVDFVTNTSFTLTKEGEKTSIYYPNIEADYNKQGIKYTKNLRSSIGATYGYIVKKYDLMNKLLSDLENNPESRRNMISLWDNQSQMEDKKALPPCVYLNKWIIRDVDDVKHLDLTLNQRSRDVLMTYSINPTEYVMFQMMIANHLTWATNTKHIAGLLRHKVDDEHIYDRNYWAMSELLEREPILTQPKIELVCEPKNFYEHTWEDFKISGVENIKPLSKKLQIAI